MGSDSVDPAVANDLLRQMILIRTVEEALQGLFARGVLNGTIHTCVGQEGCAVGLVNALDRGKDALYSNHRGHGHYLAYCDDVEGLVAEIAGAPGGVCGGMGGSQHLQRGNFYTNGIQGAGVPVAAGMALAEKLSGSGAIAVSFLGDGTFGEGAVYEALNIASLWNLPILFAVEQNHYAQTTPCELQHAGDLSERARSFGIDIHKIDGMDVVAVYHTAMQAARKCRVENRPQVVFMDTYRFGPHSKGDDFRSESEVAAHKLRDPILRLAARLEDPDRLVRETEAARLRVASIVQKLLGIAL